MPLDIGGSLLLVGAGKMGSSMLEAWLDEGLDPASVTIIDPQPPEEVRALIARHNIALNPTTGSPPAVAVIAVKPQMLGQVLEELSGRLSPDTLVVSIVAGKTIANFEAALPQVRAMVRTMPNTPAAVRRGITVAIANPATSDDQAAAVDRLLRVAGKVEWIDDEKLIDAVTAVSGSGPAYVFLLVETLAAAGVAAGLAPDLALRLARTTVEGSGELLNRSDLDAATLRRNVTSPRGTTEAALGILMAEDGLEPLMRRAVRAAADRAAELAG